MPKTRVLRPVSDCTDELSFVPFDYPAAVSSSGTTTPHPSPELHSETPVFSFTPPPPPAPRHASHHLSTVGHSPVARGAAEFAARVCWAFLVCDLTTAQLRPKSVSGVRRSIPPPTLLFSDLRSSGVHTRRGEGPCLAACMRACVLFMFDLKAGVWAGVVVFR